MAAATSAADVSRQQKYDVFLSFRGEDTRHKFTSHLHAALKDKKIDTYIDYRLERGDEIGPSLLTAIEQSKLSVIIFSKDYASSSWCLDEVVHMLKCKQAFGQLVIPVFYDIDPSHVRKQQGTYEDAFADLEKKFKDNMEKVRKWRDALTTAANLSGFHSQTIRLESELVETIVKDILTKLNRNSSYVVKGLVGMESHIQQIELLLCIHAQDVCYRTIGIWGMGGMGKTTLANAVFHLNSSKFDACLFLANVRERLGEQSDNHRLQQLRNEFLRELLNEENLNIGSPSIGSSYIIDRLSHTKVLVVLDDVSDLSQLETLLGDQVKFGRGSRIIITTRNRRLLKEIRVHEDHIYKMTELSVVEALQLFQSKAFRDDSCITDYSNLSRKVVDYAGCNPLAVKVLASSFLHCNNRQHWEEELNKLKKFPNTKIQDVLRISYNGLEENEKGIFLDIACFLKGENMCDAEKLLEMHGFSASPGIRLLIDMSLISIKYDRLEMHDLLQEMGRAIDRGIEEPGKRKRLWNAEDAYQVLHNNTVRAKLDEKRKLGVLDDGNDSKLDEIGEEKSTDDSTGFAKNRDSSDRAFYKELVKVIEASDVILEVLDARDPLGTRCIDMEKMVMKSGPNKHLVLLLNKIDLIPREAVEKWLTYLREELPAVAFKCSTQEQRSNLGWKSSSKKSKPSNRLQTSDCLGAETLLKLLKNYSRSHEIKKSITVGIIGLPNVGKSSLINSLKRCRVVNVGSTPGLTRSLQEVQLDNNVKLLDCPGVVMLKSTENNASIALRNCKRIEKLEDPIGPVKEILKLCPARLLVSIYKLPSFDSVDDFLQKVATVRGKLKKGGVVDIGAAARIVLHDWNEGKIPYYTMPPARSQEEPSEAKIVSKLGKELNIDEVYNGESSFIGSLKSVDDFHPVEVPSNCPLMFDEDMEENNSVQGVSSQTGGSLKDMVDEDDDQSMAVEEDDAGKAKVKTATNTSRQNEKLYAAEGMLNTKKKKAEKKMRKKAKSASADAMEDDYDFKVDYIKKGSAMDVSDGIGGKGDDDIIGKVPMSGIGFDEPEEE